MSLLRLSRPTARLFSTRSPLRKDPWPLPHTPQHIAATASPHESPPPPRVPRPHDEPLPTLRARLVYQSRKRGTLECDLLLSTFARERLGAMSESELREFDRLMDEPDWDIYYWATDKRPPPARWARSPLLDQLRLHARNEHKLVRRMPDLA